MAENMLARYLANGLRAMDPRDNMGALRPGAQKVANDAADELDRLADVADKAGDLDELVAWLDTISGDGEGARERVRQWVKVRRGLATWADFETAVDVTGTVTGAGNKSQRV